jgi:DNA-binding HxlR family transcriptional regulator
VFYRRVSGLAMKDSAELFEAISHPERIKILKILEKKPTSFASLKRQLGIESSGNLDFHLKKLGKLITVREDGLYGLTEAGKEALLSIDEVDSWMETKRRKLIARAHLFGGLLCISSGLLAAILEMWHLSEANVVFSLLCGLLIIVGGALILLRINTLGGVISIIFNFFPPPPGFPVPKSETAYHIYNLIYNFNPSSLTCSLIAGIVGSLPVIGALLALFVGRKMKG